LSQARARTAETYAKIASLLRAYPRAFTRLFAMARLHPDHIVPYLFYDDVERAALFLERAFGFTRVFASPAPEGGLDHAQLTHGTGKVMLGKVGPGLYPVRSAGKLEALHGGTYVYVSDVDAHCEHARRAGAKIMLEPGDMPWGDRIYCAADVEGQFWMFARREE
jgi:uncharacterized glyoxalase superfamily protein PhnB